MGILGFNKKEKAFETCIKSNQQKFYKIAFVYVKNEQDALDVLQEGILKAYSKVNSLKDIESLEAWIKRIIVNTAIDFIRKNSKNVLVPDEELINLSEKSDKNEVLFSAIDSLEEGLRDIVILKYYYGYTMNEIGEILEMPISTVKNRIHKSLKLLRISFGEGY